MKENLKQSIFLLRKGLLYKSCPSCSVAMGKYVVYNCPEFFGYRHDEGRPFIQSLCTKCRGSSFNATKTWKGYTLIEKNDLIIPAVRILPISKEVFPTYDDVKEFLLKMVPTRDNIYYYKRHNLRVQPNTLILLQYAGEIIAYAIYHSEHTIDSTNKEYANGYRGYYKFLENSIKLLATPIDGRTMYERFAKRLSQATSSVRLSYLPVLMELLDENQDDVILEEKDKNIEEKSIKEINDFSITGIHTFHAIIQGKTKDYITAHKNQMAVGVLGENLILKYEKEKLITLGKTILSKQVKIVSDDPSLGYDILSYSANGEELHIEVKSKAGMLRYFDFYISDNEYQKLKENRNHVVYYISHLRSKTPLLFKLDGSMINELNIRPVLYRVTLDYKINQDK